MICPVFLGREYAKDNNIWQSGRLGADRDIGDTLYVEQQPAGDDTAFLERQDHTTYLAVHLCYGQRRDINIFGVAPGEKDLGRRAADATPE